MSQETENKQCQICKGYLFEEDDVVVCPECGALHHRDCWNTLGHCGLEEDHGTENQYDKRVARQKEEEERTKSQASSSARVCPHCGRENNLTDAKFCPHCGKPYHGQPTAAPGFNAGRVDFAGGFPMPDALGGVPEDYEIEGVKAKHLARFTGSNSFRYVRKFTALSKENKGSWNWASFLCPSAWFFSRKMYLYGVLFFIIALASGLCFYPFQLEFSKLWVELGGEEARMTMYSFISENIEAFSLTSLIMMFVSAILQFVPMLICGRFGDWLYRDFSLERVRKITSNPEVDDLEHELTRSGNINVIAMFLALSAVEFLPTLIGSMIW